MTINVTAIDDPPTLDMNTGISLNEGASITINSSQLSASDVEDNNNTLLYAITSAPSNGTLRLSGTALGGGGGFTQADINSGNLTYTHNDSETSSDSFSFTLEDSGGNITSNISFNITIIPVNDPPTLDVNTGVGVNEGASVVITSSQLSASDVEDNDNTLTYTISTLPSHGTLFLSGTPLMIGATFTQSNINTASLTYQNNGDETSFDSFGFVIQDSGGNASSVTNFSIAIAPVNDPPVINSTAPTTATEDIPYSYLIDVSDPDDLDFSTDLSFALTNAPSGMVVTATVGNTATVTWVPGEGVTTSGAVTLTISDGGENGVMPAVEVFTITVTPVNDAPVLSTSATSGLTYNANDSPIIVADPSLTITDEDNTTLASATVRISNNFQPAEDVLSLPTPTPVGISSATYDNATGQLVIIGNGTVAQFQSALQSVTYNNTSTNPVSLTRTITFEVSDGALASNQISRTIDVIGVAPTVTFNPIDGARNVQTNADVIITFSEPMEQSNGAGITNPSIPGFFIFKEGSASGPNVSFTGAISANNRVITLIPSSGLQEGVDYYVELRANTLRSQTTSLAITTTQTSTFTTVAPPSAPPTPGNFQAFAAFPNEIELSWSDNSSDESSFEIQRSATSGTGYATIATISANLESYIDSDAALVEGNTYYYRIRALSSNGNSVFSEESSATVLGNTPDAPSNLEAFALSNSSVELTWVDNSDIETGFRIFRYNPDGTSQEFTLAADVVTFTDNGLTINTNYDYQIVAFNSSGDSEFSNLASVTTAGVPSVPQNLVATTISSTQINLSWNDATGETDYVIEVSSILEDDQFVFLTRVPADVTSLVVDTSLIDLLPNVSYSFRIIAQNEEGNSPPGATVVAKTSIDASIPVPFAPSNLDAESVSLNEISIRWQDNSSDELYFIVERSLTGNPNDFASIGITAQDINSYNDLNLTPNTLYYYRVIAVSGGGNSPASNIDNAISECNIVVIVNSDVDGGVTCDTKKARLEVITNVTDGEFQWRRNEAIIPDATLPVYLATQTGEYTCEVITSDCRKRSSRESIIIDNSFSVSITEIDGVLRSNFLAANHYQWYFEFEPITGANNETYRPTQSGVYFVIVTNGGCAATSNALDIDLTLITSNEGFDLSSSMQVSPNPAQDIIELKLNTNLRGDYEIGLMNTQGVYYPLHKGKKTGLILESSVDISNLSQGLYWLVIKMDQYEGRKKIIKY